MIFQFPVHNAILSRKTICRIRIFYLWEDQAMLRLKGIHHLAMATRDMEGTIRFWRDLLGLRLVGGLGKKGYKLYFFEICPQNYIIFFEWPHVEPVAEKDHGFPVSGPMVFDHVSFAVEDDRSLCALRDSLDAAGLWVSDVIDHGIIHSIYAFDPNGIPIEFSAPVEGADLGADPTWSIRRRSPPRCRARSLLREYGQSHRWKALATPTGA